MDLGALGGSWGLRNPEMSFLFPGRGSCYVGFRGWGGVESAEVPLCPRPHPRRRWDAGWLSRRRRQGGYSAQGLLVSSRCLAGATNMQ